MNNPHSYPRSNKRQPPQDQMVIGIHAIQELLKHAPERILRIYTITQKGQRKSELLKQCEEKGIEIVSSTEQELTRMAGTDSHQSFVAHVKGRKFYDIKEFLHSVEKQERSLVLMLDQIFDPQNFGAILRSAECFGVDGVVWSKNRGADLTPVVAKTSSGASELLKLVRISNLADSAERFKKAGFEIIAVHMRERAESLYSCTFSAKTVLIMGSEGEGIQPLLQKKADKSLFIPMKGKISSLNVAQTTSALLACYSFMEEQRRGD